ncbi:MAG TPA: hypothetical protein VGC61_01940 [Pyrinomonadaceae bacterium]|jgi:FixJ family two-component response regulator
MTKAEQVVFVIDDDPSMRTAVRDLIEAVGNACKGSDRGMCRSIQKTQTVIITVV